MVGKTIETHWLVKKLIDFRKKLMNYEISLSTRTFLRCKKSSQNHDKDTPNIFYGFHDKPLTRRALCLLRPLFLYTSLYCLLALFFINKLNIFGLDVSPIAPGKYWFFTFLLLYRYISFKCDSFNRCISQRTFHRLFTC